VLAWKRGQSKAIHTFGFEAVTGAGAGKRAGLQRAAGVGRRFIFTREQLRSFAWA